MFPSQLAFLRAAEARGVAIDTLPAWSYDWFEANALAAWLHPAGRLPTQAEWEYVARGGPAPSTAWTDADLDAVAWHKESSLRIPGEPEGPRPVCELEDRKRLHPLGVCDILGNVWEWVADRRDLRSQLAPVRVLLNPVNLRFGADRGRCGGAYTMPKGFATPHSFHGQEPSHHFPQNGVRVVRSEMSHM